MTRLILLAAAAMLVCGGSAFAQAAIGRPAGYNAPPMENAVIAHHDRQVARRAAAHGNYRRAAIANHAANVAAAQANAPR
jgi:hypothetical protein